MKHSIIGVLLALGFLVYQVSSDDEILRDWWDAGEGRAFVAEQYYPNDEGLLGVMLSSGELGTEGHPFFEPIGNNGRACVTCHQPHDAMSLSVESVRQRYESVGLSDPLFAAVDGSNCPTLPQEEPASHSLLLDYGLIRVQRPWPPAPWNGEAITPDIEIEVVRDPWGCNTGAEYGLDAKEPSVSVYRRPRPVANMKYLLAVGFAYDPKRGLPLMVDPETGTFISGNLMADARATTLKVQMEDAALTHLQMLDAMTPQQQQQIEDFILSVYAAQISHKDGGYLNEGGAEGGPEKLAVSSPGQLGSIGTPVWSEFTAWEKVSEAEKAQLSPEETDYRQSVARGARVFREKMFLITDTAGINSPMGFGNPVRNSCVFCHNMSQMGNDVAPGQVDLGTVNKPFADPAPHLPLFKVTCMGEPHPHYGPVIYTYDPGFALTTGQCADVGKITLQSLRGLAARAPYFSNGSAKDIEGIIDYYDRRYSIGYTEQEKQDLINLMGAL